MASPEEHFRKCFINIYPLKNYNEKSYRINIHQFPLAPSPIIGTITSWSSPSPLLAPLPQRLLNFHFHWYNFNTIQHFHNQGQSQWPHQSSTTNIPTIFSSSTTIKLNSHYQLQNYHNLICAIATSKIACCHYQHYEIINFTPINYTQYLRQYFLYIYHCDLVSIKPSLQLPLRQIKQIAFNVPNTRPGTIF